MVRTYQWSFFFLVAVILILSGCSGADITKNAASVASTGLSKDEIRSEAFKDLFPLQYDSYQKTMEEEDTKYGGSINRSKYDADKEPYLPILFNGYGFATQYTEDRGHMYANEDIRETARITDKSIGSCLTCKSTAVPQMIEEMGDEYWSGSFNDVIWPKAEAMGHSPIGCSDCHDPETMDLRITRPSFIKAMESQGIDLSNPTKNDMRSYVCGQCHVEYYFAPENGEVTFPWANGFKPEDMYEYYETTAKERGFEKDWIHNVSGTPMLKVQHPEFETHIEGPHGKADVSCADCHMPYERADGKKKITSHWIKSPLKSMEQSCATCHSNRDLDALKERVMQIQDTHIAALHKAEDISITSHYYVNKMISSGVSEDKIKKAQEHVRKGQWHWDIIAAENGAGFHNPQGAMDSLRTSIEESNKAIQIGIEELVKKGVNLEELNKEIEKAKKAVFEEKDNFKKKEHAINSYFPAIQPPSK
ncbi:ammonia-forming cytochrome c nitrite reductase subunit c552 [Bacillus sp. FJAT-29790]|uniref:ammonia-forming cytochrome c nitrite reductase subunit c552 n=1 Tax=Bacillus sp. FJAT-29790 TaxID=1895002 RepID=UPI001C24A6B3|nr:ammonia-forming cytochrome c nitrite reductase subunit c552 [Bacillus sp. FJAT-29790]MBU8879815.1 ammonia-forming cytochrome c nitrite reductase subunit c552 [Bacillus sp. FJAT-29790]